MPLRMHMNRQALFVIKGEVSLVIASLKKTARWNAHQADSKSDVLLRKLFTLKEALDSSKKSALVKVASDANYFLEAFLDVVKSDDTSGPVTVVALTSIEKFISYEIVNEANGSTGAVEAITNGVIHARFVSSDSASDELVLMKILQVLHRLFTSPLGPLLSNESVCELMQSCFRMCFIESTNTNELLKKSAESALTEMICLLFSRLHSFPAIESSRKSKSSISSDSGAASEEKQNNAKADDEEKVTEVLLAPGDVHDPTIVGAESVEEIRTPVTCMPEIQVQEATPQETQEDPNSVTGPVVEEKPGTGRDEALVSSAEFKTKRGVKFTVSGNEILQSPSSEDPSLYASCPTSPATSEIQTPANMSRAKITVPYGIPCVRELFRFLISLINPHDKRINELMIHVGLKLLLVSVETGIDCMAKHSSLLGLVKNELCKNLIALLSYSPPPNSMLTASSILLNVMRILLLVFDSARHHLKYQQEVFLARMMELLVDPSAGNTNVPVPPPTPGLNGSRWSYEQREIGMDFLVQIWKLPCFITELYLNYDCDLYSPNLFEDVTKMMSKNAFALQGGINSIHLLCVEGLVSILDGIESHCTLRISNPALNLNSSISSVASEESHCSSVFYHDPPGQFTSPRLQKAISNGSMNEDLDFGADDIEDNAGSLPSETPTATPISTPAAKSKTGYINSGNSRSSEEACLPSHEELMAVRHKKKILHTGSEQFNNNAKKGIEFLQSQGLLSSPLDPVEVARFLRENPLLDKKTIGDYISNKKQAEILHAFVWSFDFAKTRIDVALRMFLETFRLPGEAPLISIIMEELASHWQTSNNNMFADTDSAYRLLYAIIMLNVDQHNSNVKKQGNSMKFEDFKRNLRKCNGDQDFDPEMLLEIYNGIKSEEIVMPAEHTGLVKENYLWKVMLKRGSSPACSYVRPKFDEGVFDHDLFSISKVPIVAALSVIFDKTTDATFIHKCLSGFRKCATISAHYGMSDVFDNLVISLCKFTTLLSTNQDLVGSKKAQAACRAVFQHVHRHGDILREGWKNFIECLVALFKMQILPKILMESEDFTEPSGRISLVRRTLAAVPRVEAGLFSSLYSYIALSTDSPGSRSSVAEEEENKKRVHALVAECRPELLLSESKFLQLDSLQELIKSLIGASPVPDSKRKDYDEDTVVFVMEVLLKITVQNRDRALLFWEIVREHLFEIIIAASVNDMPYLLERSVVGLMRVSLRLMRKEDLCPVILQSLKILLYLKPAAVVHLSQQMSFGLHEILKTTAANIHTAEEWTIIFTLLEYVGAGKVPQTLNSSIGPLQVPEPGSQLYAAKSHLPSTHHPTLQHSLSQDPIPQAGPHGGAGLGYSSGSDRGYTSDSELEVKGAPDAHRYAGVSPAQSWILLSQDDQSAQQSPRKQVQANSQIVSQAPSVQLERQLFYPDPKSVVKSCETLSFIVRDAAHITPDNFSLCVSTIRSFVESSTLKARPVRTDQMGMPKKRRGKKSHQVPESLNVQTGMSKSKSFPGPGTTPYDADESDSEDQIGASHQVSLQLLDLLHTLHLRAAQIFQWWQKENSDIAKNSIDASIWTLGWKPILQGIATLCADSRNIVRKTALNYLQGALLVHDLQQLTAAEWHSCFSQVLFPLMDRLLQPLNPQDVSGMEETRMRAVTLLSRVFLQHLSPLSQLESFPNLWLHILDFLERYLTHSEKNELLAEGIPENLKNLLLVMQTGGVFHTSEGYTRLWVATWEKIDSFLPGLRGELFRSVSVETTRPAPVASPQPTTLSEVLAHSGVPEVQSEAPTAPSLSSALPEMSTVSNPIPLPTEPAAAEHVTAAMEPGLERQPVDPEAHVPAPAQSLMSTSPVPTFTIQIEE